MQPSFSLQTFGGHSAPVTSLDFHPNNGDFICSCDSVNEVRYWNVKNGGCDQVLKVRAGDYIMHIQYPIKDKPKLLNFLAFECR